MLTDEEYYFAMREYEQWLDEQAEKERVTRLALSSPTFMNWVLNNSIQPSVAYATEQEQTNDPSDM